MSNISQIEKGLSKYVDKEILSNLSENQLERFAIGIGVSIFIKKNKCIS